MADVTALPDGKIVLAVLPGVALTPQQAREELIKHGYSPSIADDLIHAALRQP